jgi:membrane-associated protease RseP (regulator of RpoE activity)
MTIFLLLFASCVLAYAAHSAGIALAGRLAGAAVEELALFLGPPLLRFEVRGVTLRLNLLPLGSYVKFADRSDRPEARGRFLRELPPLTRAAIAASGCLTLLALAALCLGPSAAAQKLLSGFGQVVAGPLRPFSTGARLLSLLAEFARTHPFAATLGLVAAKMTALNLLPVPTLNGADILFNLAELFLKIPASLKSVLNPVGLLLVLACWVSWSAALVYLLYS